MKTVIIYTDGDICCANAGYVQPGSRRGRRNRRGWTTGAAGRE